LGPEAGLDPGPVGGGGARGPGRVGRAALGAPRG
jgi:hypothetical protein